MGDTISVLPKARIPDLVIIFEVIAMGEVILKNLIFQFSCNIQHEHTYIILSHSVICSDSDSDTCIASIVYSICGKLSLIRQVHAATQNDIYQIRRNRNFLFSQHNDIRENIRCIEDRWRKLINLIGTY